MTKEETLKTTPLLQEHKRLNAKLSPFGGWLMPIQYEGIIAEHNWTRSSASLFDICHMGKFIVYGDANRSGLNRIVTADLTKADLNSCHYCFMLNENGGIIDDLVVYRIENDKWMLVVNAATTDKDEGHLKRHLLKDSKIENISDSLGKLDLQGPLSKDILSTLVDSHIADLKYYQFERFFLSGEENIVSRTGYTGEFGYEIYISTNNVYKLWARLLSDNRIKPAGLGARDTLRLEMGYPLYGQDIDDNTTPLEAGLGQFVDFNKEFIGKDTLLKQKQKGVNKKLIYFITGSRRAPRHNYQIYSKNKKIGQVTSGSFSPSLSCGIGIGYVESAYAKTGLDIIISDNNIEISSRITERPFYKKGTARSN